MEFQHSGDSALSIIPDRTLVLVLRSHSVTGEKHSEDSDFTLNVQNHECSHCASVYGQSRLIVCFKS